MLLSDTKITSKPFARALLKLLDINGEHYFVSFFKGHITDADISGIIGHWACTNEHFDNLVDSYWKLHSKIYKL